MLIPLMDNWLGIFTGTSEHIFQILVVFQPCTSSPATEGSKWYLTHGTAISGVLDQVSLDDLGRWPEESEPQWSHFCKSWCFWSRFSNPSITLSSPCWCRDKQKWLTSPNSHMQLPAK